MAGGRPTLYSAEMDAEVCELVATGSSLVTVCETLGIGYRTVYQWLEANTEFAQRYARACEARADYIADEIIAIADDGSRDYKAGEDGVALVNHDHIARSRLRVDARKWAASKLAPKKYGDKIQAEVFAKITLLDLVNASEKTPE